MERIRRRLQSEAAFGLRRSGVIFDPMHPWGRVFQRAASQADVETVANRKREVFNEALLFVAQ
eukprot:5099303-Alexandrium_andersonii.AAC.1